MALLHLGEARVWNPAKLGTTLAVGVMVTTTQSSGPRENLNAITLCSGTQLKELTIWGSVDDHVISKGTNIQENTRDEEEILVTKEKAFTTSLLETEGKQLLTVPLNFPIQQ
ncbi:hypothetical protein PIB30_072155 [Stylosanthes scabra]|uniref:Uncharacterized protein n=1 Tax=Stylosanthes scabra TaxID=79078 RepID=A0ABU6SQQ9_9FABA|nr:hypothetical protein [Stylosanthes scabra]